MKKFQRKIKNTVSGTIIMVDADVALCEHCNAIATSCYPVGDMYGEYYTDILVCDQHNPYIDTPKVNWADMVGDVSNEDVRQGIKAMERGEIA